MTLEQLIARFRTESNDRVEPYFCSDDDVTQWLADAEEEAAIRARLLIEDTNPLYCDIAVAAGSPSAPLHARVYEITYQSFVPTGGPKACEIVLVSREMLDRVYPEWRELPAGDPRWLIQSETAVRLVPTPSRDGLLRIEAYRLPLKRISLPTQKPEIHEANHVHLVNWALFKGYSIPDPEFNDQGRARTALDAFEQHFGLRPDANLRRSTRSDEVQTTVVHTF